MPKRAPGRVEELIKNKNFGALTETTVDPIAHAICTMYHKCKREDTYQQFLPLIEPYIYKIIKGDVITDDICNILWACKIWLTDDLLVKNRYNEMDGEFNRAILNCAKALKVEGSSETGYFECFKAPSWDSTPEIYEDARSTMYALINLMYINKIILNKADYESLRNNVVLMGNVDNAIKLGSGYIGKDATQKNIKSNPYLSALFIRYKLAEIDTHSEDSSELKKTIFNYLLKNEGTLEKEANKHYLEYVYNEHARKIQAITGIIFFLSAVVTIDQYFGLNIINNLIDFIRLKFGG